MINNFHLKHFSEWCIFDEILYGNDATPNSGHLNLHSKLLVHTSAQECSTRRRRWK